MTQNQKNIIQAIREECSSRNTSEFDFSVEMWGAMWMPWYIYIDSVSIKLPVDTLESSDFECFIKNGLIEKVREYRAEELDEPLEISRTKYKLTDRDML